MGNVLQVAMMAGVVLEAGLLVRLTLKRAWRQSPWFVALIACFLVSACLKFVVYYTYPGAYASAYWKLTAVEIAFAIVAIGEQVECVRFGIAVGITVGTCLVLLGNYHFYGWAGLAIAVTAGILESRRRSRIVEGIVLFWFPWFLLLMPPMPHWVSGVPVLCWVGALIVWFFVPMESES